MTGGPVLGRFLEGRTIRRSSKQPRPAGLILGLAIVGGLLILSVVGPLISPYSPVEADARAILQPPSAAHPFGTDSAGFDILTRTLYAPRIDLYIALVGTTGSVMLGVPLGLFAGFFAHWRGGWGIASEVVMRSMDILQAFPVFILAMALVAASGRSITNVILAIVFLNAPVFVRLIRAEILRIRNRAHVDAAFLAGNSRWRIASRHILPLSVGPVLVQFSVTAGFAVLLTAGLSFVGAGVRLPTPEWGLMVASGANGMVTGLWWVALFPGLFLGLSVFGLALIGDAIGKRVGRGSPH